MGDESRLGIRRARQPGRNMDCVLTPTSGQCREFCSPPGMLSLFDSGCGGGHNSLRCSSVVASTAVPYFFPAGGRGGFPGGFLGVAAVEWVWAMVA